MNVLIVEDDQLLLRSLESSVLSIRPDASVRGARSIEDADRELATAGPPDIILLDLGLPDAEGFSGLEHFRAAAPRAAIAIVSGSSEPAVMLGAVALGASAYLEKCRDPSAFLKGLRTFFDDGFFAPAIIADSFRSRADRICK